MSVNQRAVKVEAAPGSIKYEGTSEKIATTKPFQQSTTATLKTAPEGKTSGTKVEQVISKVVTDNNLKPTLAKEPPSAPEVDNSKKTDGVLKSAQPKVESVPKPVSQAAEQKKPNPTNVNQTTAQKVAVQSGNTGSTKVGATPTAPKTKD